MSSFLFADDLNLENIAISATKDERPKIVRAAAIGHHRAATQGEEDEPRDDGVLGVGSLKAFDVQEGGIQALVLTPDGMGAYSAGDDGKVVYSEIITMEDGVVRELSTRVVLTSDRPIYSLALSADGKLLAVGQTSSIVIYDPVEQRIKYKLSRVQGRITSLAWDPRGEILLMGLAGGEIYGWSLKQGFFEGRGRDSTEALEEYIGSTTSIGSLMFHPSGGAFFAQELEGSVSLWRLLRTEHEIGLRDSFAVSDEEKSTNKRKVFAQLRTQLLDMWLDWDGTSLYVSATDGGIYSWKVRGLIAREKLDLVREEPFGLTGILLPSSKADVTDRSRAHMIYVSGRQQRLTLLCRPGEQLAELETPKKGPTGKLLENVRRVAQTELLGEPLGILRSTPSSSMVWGAQKSRRLVIFDGQRLAGKDLIKKCTQ